jgi:SNF2 family DNA or RNA helicase
MIRRVVADVRETVADFPELPPVHHIHTVEMPAESDEKIIFDRLVQRFQDAIEDHAQGMVILELYMRIRQFLAHPAIYVEAMRRKYGTRYPRTEWLGTASKMDVFARMLADMPREPTIVFGTFTRELDIAATKMQAAGYHIIHIRGGMTDGVRNSILREARTLAEAGTPVGLIVQIVTGNAGLNMQYAARVIFLSSHWNPSVVDQAVGRSYRIGQTRRVEVHHILLADAAQKNLDRLIVKAHLKKRDLARKVLPSLIPDSAIESDHILNILNEVAAPDAAAAAIIPIEATTA